MSEEEPIKVASVKEAQQIANETGRPVTYILSSEVEQPSFQPRLGFFGSLRLRFWLLRRRIFWFIQKVIEGLKK